MFYYISKLFWAVAQPSAVLALLFATALLLLYRGRTRPGQRLLAGTLALYLLLGVSPLAHLATIPLENRFSRPDATELARGIDGIIVLGGGVDGTVSRARDVLALNEAGERILEALMLGKAHPRARLIISGGAATLLYSGLSDGAAVGRVLTRLLDDPRRVVLEQRSLNTWQNARETRRLLRPQPGQRFLLLTSAFHMPRAVGCFRKVGIEVLPWPVDYRTRGWADLWRFFDKPSEGLRRFDLILREWVGLVAYRLSGRTDALLPAP